MGLLQVSTISTSVAATAVAMTCWLIAIADPSEQRLGHVAVPGRGTSGT
jgi:hypothetical protein